MTGARLIRRAARLLAAGVGALAAMIPAAAMAQHILAGPPPTRYTVDERGVDVRTGAFTYSVTEVAIGPPGEGGLAYTRTFAGDGWRDNMTGTLEVVTPTRYVVSIGGMSEAFDRSGSTYTPVTNTGSTLTAVGVNYTYITRDGTEAVFALPFNGAQNPAGGSAGRIYSLKRPSGEYLSFYYREFHYGPIWEPDDPVLIRLQSVTSTYGYQIKFEYEIDNPTSPWDEGGFFKLTGVTALNNAVDYCAPSADDCPAYTQDWPSVTYNWTMGGEEEVTDNLGRKTTYGYNGDRVNRIRLPDSATDDITVTYTGARVSAVNAGGSTWSYSYADAGGNRTATITDPQSNQTVAISAITAGTLTSVRNPLNQTTAYQYDAQGRLTRITLPEGNYTQFTLDGRGNVTQTRAVAKSGSGLADIVTSAAFPASCANRLTCNRPTTTTDPNGWVTDYSWSTTHGGLLSVTAPAPSPGAVRPETRFSYTGLYAWVKNSSGAYVQEFSPIQMLTGVSSCATLATCTGGADEVRTTLAYGSTGTANNLLPTTVTSGSGNGTLAATVTTTWTPQGDPMTVDGPLAGTTDTTRYRYDSMRQLIGVVGPDPDAGGALKNRAVRYTYNPNGWVTLVEQGTVNGYTDPNWAAFSSLQQTGAAYDRLGRPLRSWLSSGGVTFALLQTSYDSLGRADCTAVRMNPASFASPPASACTAATAGTFGPDRITKFAYDAASRPTGTTSGFGTADTIAETVTWTANGLAQTLTDGSGNASIIVYDGFDRQERKRYPNATGGGTSTTDYEQYGWDAASNLISLRNRAGESFSFGYDRLDRRVSLTSASVTGQVWTWDNLGRPLSTGFSSGAAQTVSWGWDALSRPLTETGPLGTMTSQYDLAGRRTRLTWPDGYYAAYDYDLYSAVTKIRENGANSGAGVLGTYAYDNLGRRTGITRGNGVSTGYTWDGASRLTGLSQNLTGTASDLTLTLGYNPAGQIISRGVSNTAYSFLPATGSTAYANNGRNQVTSAGGTSVTYDGRFNVTGDGAASWGYDALGRMTSSTAGGSSAAWAYDPAGRLYQSTVSATTTRFVYDGAQAAGEYNAAGAVVRRHVPGPGLDEPVVSYEGSGTTDRRWLLGDERGSIVAIASGAGAALSINTYDEYGVPGAGNAGRFQYTGQMWLPQAGAYHYRARAYRPQLGRFLQPDPIGYAGGANLWAYVGGDPVNSVDPWGLCGGPGEEACDMGEIVVRGTRVVCLLNPRCYQIDTSGRGLGPVDFAPRGGQSLMPKAPKPTERVCRRDMTDRLNFFGKDEQIYVNSTAVTNPFEGSFLVQGHGDEYGVYQGSSAINSSTLSGMISSHPSYSRGQDVTLGACNLSENYQQELSNQLGACVNAPRDFAWYPSTPGSPIYSAPRDDEKKPRARTGWRRLCPE